MKMVKIADVVLVNFNVVHNNYQQNSRVLHAFVPNKLFGQLLDIKTFIFLKTFNSEFSYLTYGLLIKILNC